MMDRFLHSFVRLGSPVRDLLVSAAGCFVLVKGFRLIATGKEGAGNSGLPFRRRLP
jgi:hypothetical protein